jgi:hypothetical protein
VNWILDADIAAYFDTVSHDWMLRFLEHRIGDRRMLRLISPITRPGRPGVHKKHCGDGGVIRWNTAQEKTAVSLVRSWPVD